MGSLLSNAVIMDMQASILQDVGIDTKVKSEGRVGRWGMAEGEASLRTPCSSVF